MPAGQAPAGAGEQAAKHSLDNGKAWQKFQRICEAQGGMRTPPISRHQRPVHAARAGVVETIDNRKIARLAKLAGQRVPLLLNKAGYSGNEVCSVCHVAETATWELTNHATAFDTLVRHGADGRGECVSCHVVGYGKPGGYQVAQPDP